MKSNYFLAFLEEAACVGCSPPSVHPSIHPVFHPSVYLSISIPLLAILSLFLYTVLGFNHCCNWQLPAVLTHTCIRFLCALLLQIPLAISYVCVSVRARVLVSVCVPARVCVCVWGARRGRYGEIRIMKEVEFQNCRPTHQSVCCEARWGNWSCAAKL